ncbi:LexA-binding, inner membrane-associated putative hydrolase [Halogranum amylolyticum]|uniref:LexA-binding, inner membrane-associated putative hydrolase n=1 Tax=Halogranum amylolyticum TaxID=660520 RepID=A0A1H8UTP0_9EURY|nr:metal-dependent hydrolase [Halogranum amylolyticum]SEP05938.1 LexA-binding, inner membrane-associated putative hydrolase [Halogranum amylolyticum]
MQSPGHIGMALLFAVPAWFVFSEAKASLAFTALTASMGMFPDGDLVLMQYFFVEHHGLTHSFVFIVPAALLLGAVVTGGYLLVRDDTHTSTAAVYAFATIALFTGMTAHVVADLVTTPDIAPPLKPLYPLVTDRVILDVAFVKSKLWNLGTLALGIVAQGSLALRAYLR